MRSGKYPLGYTDAEERRLTSLSAIDANTPGVDRTDDWFGE
jgi:hypothetical protein